MWTWSETIWAVYAAEDFGVYTAGDRISPIYPGNSFWAGFGGFCQANNDGDPVVLYDDQAGRWFFSQFSIGQGIQCVAISTDGAIRGMLLPGTMAIAAPLVIGFIRADMLAGMLVGALASGLMLGIQCANSGGAMDNAKKYIEEGKITDPKTGEVLGKGSETHKAAVVGDTVGDPLKDTVGPSINILIKLMAVISLVFAPLF